MSGRVSEVVVMQAKNLTVDFTRFSLASRIAGSPALRPVNPG